MTTIKKIRQLADEFIVYKKAMGYIYETSHYYLNRYIDYIEKVNPDAIYLEKQITKIYFESLSETQATLHGTVSVLREFSNYLIINGYEETYVIPPKVSKKPTPEPPYFFTQEEILLFFEKLDEVKAHPSFKGREIVLPTLFRLIYCCGLRCKEARTLKCCNVHADKLYIDVLESKGPKSRRIYISKELVTYLTDYDIQINILFPNREYYFPYKDGYYGGGMISNNFNKFWMEAYPNFPKSNRPRAYDFRHHLAWANLNQWAQEGLDINVMLAYLMRYMGHKSINETLYYFHFVPEFFPIYRDMSKSLENVLPEVQQDE